MMFKFNFVYLQVSMRELVAGLALLLVATVCISPATSSAQECGDNPMKEVLQVAKRTGKLSHKDQKKKKLA